MSDEPCITVSDLANRLNGTFAGDGTRVIRDVATLEQATPDSISWVGSKDLLERAARSKAGVLLVPCDCPISQERTIIRVTDPDLALVDVLDRLAPPTAHVPHGIDPTASVAPDAGVEGAAIGPHVYVGGGSQIGVGTEVHAGVYIGAHVTVGRDCVLWPNVVVRERAKIGDRVIIHPNATIGADGFGYLQRGGKHRKIPQIGTVIIEDDVEIGANSTIDRARSGATRIGSGTKIDNLVQIAHNVQMGEDCIIVGQSGIAGSCSLGNHVVLSGQVGVTDHRVIGSNVQIAAKSAVMRDIPDGQIVRGIPATDHRRFLREQAALRKLPEWLQRVRELARRVDELEVRSDG